MASSQPAPATAPATTPATAGHTFVAAHTNQASRQPRDILPGPSTSGEQRLPAIATNDAQGTPPGENKGSQVDEIAALKKQIKKLQDMAESASVEDALAKVMELAHTPVLTTRLQLISALRALVDRATIAAHPKLPRFRAVLAQFEANDFGEEAGRLLVLLLGNKEEEEIAAKVSKFMRHTNHTYKKFADVRYAPYARKKKTLDEIKCFTCHELGHMARSCPKKKI
ncbi:uncharacterized protein [Ptychodera flava]|uniref:uncharacterized protein isoform X2 n=1 Tax=Ptychodera flava TaxID=63121 RepID=UPI00396A65CF